MNTFINQNSTIPFLRDSAIFNQLRNSDPSQRSTIHVVFECPLNTDKTYNPTYFCQS